MPRSRRRHHSKSRSRSRSHSHDRDREAKRRKIESFESPHNKRSVSSEPEANEPPAGRSGQDRVGVGAQEEVAMQTVECIGSEETVCKILDAQNCDDEPNSNTIKDSECQEKGLKTNEKILESNIPMETEVENLKINEGEKEAYEKDSNIPKETCLKRERKDSTDSSVSNDDKTNTVKVVDKETVIIVEDDGKEKPAKKLKVVPGKSTQSPASKTIKDFFKKVTTPKKNREVSASKSAGNTPKSTSSSNNTPSDKKVASALNKSTSGNKENASASNDPKATSSSNKKDSPKTSTDSEKQTTKTVINEVADISPTNNKNEFFKNASINESPASKTETESHTTTEVIDLDECAHLDDPSLSSEGMVIKSKATESVKIQEITPKKAMSPKQLQRRLESEKKRVEKQKEKEEREKKRQEEKDERKKQKEAALQEKLKEKDAKVKEREMKRKEKEEREDVKRKEKEQEKLRKQQEIDDKNREKQKIEEQKQKAAAAFVNFFVPKKPESNEKKETVSTFMPFEVKSDMRLAPIVRKTLSDAEKQSLIDLYEEQCACKLYLDELKGGKNVGKDKKTWSYDDGSDDVTILDDFGEPIVEQKSRMRAKYLKFHENQRPAYYGTWRKKSTKITPLNPFNKEDIFNYEVDSDDEWEDEEDGESIAGSDEEDKENESENDYEVDNDFFVPHGHLSDDEGVDNEDEKLNPDAQKARLKLLKNQFDEEMKSKTQRLKPRVLGCIWYENDKKIDEAIDRHLQPYTVICPNIITIAKRSEFAAIKLKQRAEKKGLEKELIPDFLRLLHGSTNKRMHIIREYMEYLNKKGIIPEASKIGIRSQIIKLAQWKKCQEEGPMFKKQCWLVPEEVMNEYCVELKLPNTWSFFTK